MTLNDLVGMLDSLDWPAATFRDRPIRGKQAWLEAISVFPPMTPGERVAVARLLWRELLCVTAVGRRRLRAWIDERRRNPALVEIAATRAQRIRQELHYHGDVEPLPLVADTVARMAAPVGDYVTGACVFVVSGRTTAGWTDGPLPPLPVIVLAGHLDDAQLTGVVRHEAAHRWLIETPVVAAPRVAQLAAVEQMNREYGFQNITRFIQQQEQEADWLAWSMA